MPEGFEEGQRSFAGRGGFAVIGGLTGQQPEQIVPGLLQPARFPVRDTEEFYGIVVQPFPHISVMDVADLKIAIGPLEAGR